MTDPWSSCRWETGEWIITDPRSSSRWETGEETVKYVESVPILEGDIANVDRNFLDATVHLSSYLRFLIKFLSF
jgi:hypothetical protein